MKKTFKCFIAFFACFILALAPLALVGCGDSAVSDEEINAIMTDAAKSFYADHNSADNYSDATFHWLETDTSKETVKLNYKQNATDEQTIDGTFENKTVETVDTTVALKKSGEHIIAQVIIVKTATEKSYEVKDDATLNEINSTTIITKNYRLFTYAQDEETKNVLLYEETQKVDGGETEVVVKKYGTKADLSTYDEFVKNYMLRYTNQNIARTFFQNSEILLFYKALVNLEKDGNLFKISVGYDNLIGVDYDNDYQYHVNSVSSKTTIFFKDGKIWKSYNYAKQIGETFSAENTMSFEFSASATVDTTVPVLSDYEGPTNTVYSNYSAYSLQDVMMSLPSGGLFS